MLDAVRTDLGLIVARTFSKIYGMAGLRLGYAVAQPDAIGCIHTMPPHDVSVPAAAAALASLALRDRLGECKAYTAAGRDDLIRWFAARPRVPAFARELRDGRPRPRRATRDRGARRARRACRTQLTRHAELDAHHDRHARRDGRAERGAHARARRACRARRHMSAPRHSVQPPTDDPP
ncbi:MULTISPECIES: aminotransferase class I/II-fold pyridoxal phosphate-dependent enzyme [unclassified Burkholderia]|uniref:aminotransferase class I/II-fold pyridoxal phosphate-dependent enzyme n=1 Tax=unclassified Burkholderia TaxID=2613784 RepID=UPI000A446CE3|nr:MULTISPECIES: aminotransferase class I/II-fold pyridoxal phosphate-dependent enzyme [unclassified Burkholderia]